MRDSASCPSSSASNGLLLVRSLAITVKVTSWFNRIGVEAQDAVYLQSSSLPLSLYSVSPYCASCSALQSLAPAWLVLPGSAGAPPSPPAASGVVQVAGS